jgi:large subunit ribosomal protein L17
MRHRKDGRQLGRNTAHRKALFRSLLTALFDHERIETTLAKAKELKALADRMITFGKSGTLAARRRALTCVWRKDVVAKLFKDIAPRFSSRAGGYTRIIKTRRRVGDGAEMVAIELVEQAVPTPTADQKAAS